MLRRFVLVLAGGYMERLKDSPEFCGCLGVRQAFMVTQLLQAVVTLFHPPDWVDEDEFIELFSGPNDFLKVVDAASYDAFTNVSVEYHPDEQAVSVCAYFATNDNHDHPYAYFKWAFSEETGHQINTEILRIIP